jgi:formylglycine-generating enzyme required for sulfatase activity/serine/threonine protein kinase
MTEREIFLAILDLPNAAARSGYLDRVCSGDPARRARIESLLLSHDTADSFLDCPAVMPPQRHELATEVIDSVATPDDADDALDFLQPSTRPDSLGRLGHYEILEVLGQGGFGIVFRAFDETLQRMVAIKVLSAQIAATSPARKRFLREARSSAKVRHENIVHVYAVEEQPLPYLVMEFIPGETLQQRLDRTGPLETADVLEMGRQIALGLAAAHGAGLVHRDIKPGNILIEAGPHPHVKITDFGLARAADDASMTQSGTVAGTPMFMAPEQALGDTLDHRADLFSLGSVLYTMCSGRPPFRAANPFAVLKRVAEDTPRPIPEIIPEVPRWLCDIITRLHSKNPADRFSSAQEVADLLARGLEDLRSDGTRGALRFAARPAPDASEATVPRSPDPGETVTLPLRVRPRFANRRHRVVAASLLLALLAGLGLAEASGVTNVRGVVVRLFFPDGTLVVEVDDPGVSVRIDGSELVITGTGVKELRVKPGDYRVVASKDGRVVQQDLVRVERNGRRVIRVTRETVSAAISDKGLEPLNRKTAAEALAASAPKEITNSIGMKLVLIPAGEFLMGSPDSDKDAQGGENPQHRVRITRPFYLGATEVTVGQFRRVVETAGYQTEAEKDGKGGRRWNAAKGSWEDGPQYTWRNPGFAQTDEHPVVMVSWNDALAYCNLLNDREGSKRYDGYRLPTEAEWEYACRAGTTSRYVSGDDPETLALVGNIGDGTLRVQYPNWQWPTIAARDGFIHTAPVRQFRPNAFNLYDMHGNVWEWCQDGYDKNYYGQSPGADPAGPLGAADRVIRGGGWGINPQGCRSAYRSRHAPDARYESVGFRVARVQSGP